MVADRSGYRAGVTHLDCSGGLSFPFRFRPIPGSTGFVVPSTPILFDVSSAASFSFTFFMVKWAIEASLYNAVLLWFSIIYIFKFK